MPAQTQQTLVTRIAEKVEELAASGRPGVLLVDPAVRQAVREVVAHALPHVAVLGYGEVVQDVDVEAVGLVSMNA
jgi:flagellar biosynthesis protein FlhA